MAKKLWFLYILESTVSWLPIELNLPEKEYYLPPNTEQEYIPKLEILLGEVFRK